MSEKKAKLMRKQAKYKPKVEKDYRLVGAKTVNTGGGKDFTVGGSLRVKGPRALYKQIKKASRNKKHRGK